MKPTDTASCSIKWTNIEKTTNLLQLFNLTLSLEVAKLLHERRLRVKSLWLKETQQVVKFLHIVLKGSAGKQYLVLLHKQHKHKFYASCVAKAAMRTAMCFKKQSRNSKQIYNNQQTKIQPCYLHSTANASQRKHDYKQSQQVIFSTLQPKLTQYLPCETWHPRTGDCSKNLGNITYSYFDVMQTCKLRKNKQAGVSCEGNE